MVDKMLAAPDIRGGRKIKGGPGKLSSFKYLALLVDKNNDGSSASKKKKAK